MDSIIAHAHVLSLMGAEAATAPDHWRHDTRDGSLTYRYAGSSNTYTWNADAVADLAERARDCRPPSSEAGRLLERWPAVERLLAADGLAPPDYFCVDHGTDEFTLVWEEQKLVVIIGPTVLGDELSS